MKKLIGIGSLAKTALLIAATSRTVNDPENTDNRRFAPFYDERDVIPHNGSTFEFVGVDMDAKRCEPDDFLIGYKIPSEHQLIITDEAVNIHERQLRKLDMSQEYGSLRDYNEFSKRREPVPVYERGDTRQLVFGQIVEQRGPVIDTSRVTKRSKRRNRHK